MYHVIKQQDDGSFNFPSGNGQQKYFASQNEAMEIAKEYAAKYAATYVVFKAVVAAKPITPPIEGISL